MYIERDAKILLINRSIVGLVFFIPFYILIFSNKNIQSNPLMLKEPLVVYARNNTD